MKTYTVPIEELTPDPDNARQHGAENLAAIASSLALFEQRRPLVVWRRPDALVVVAGNGTLEAARYLGWTHIVVTEVPEDWDEATVRAYALADNRTAELASWDEAALGGALLELEGVGYEPTALGFDPEALASPSVEAPGVQSFRVVVGAFSTVLDEAAFYAWREQIVAAVGSASGDIEAEISRRLEL